MSTCWSPGQPDGDCPNFGLCCFDGCANTCGEGDRDDDVSDVDDGDGDGGDGDDDDGDDDGGDGDDDDGGDDNGISADAPTCD